MNHLVFLDAQAGELEKILSGLKTMVLKEFDPARPAGRPSPGDRLYFLRDTDEYALRVQATVVRVLSLAHHADKERCQILKEMQPRLQLTEDQYNTWVTKKQVLLVEFASAQKMGVVQLAADRIADRSEWIPFIEFGVITAKVSDQGRTLVSQTRER
jgi:hypothetical protein